MFAATTKAMMTTAAPSVSFDALGSGVSSFSSSWSWLHTAGTQASAAFVGWNDNSTGLVGTFPTYGGTAMNDEGLGIYTSGFEAGLYSLTGSYVPGGHVCSLSVPAGAYMGANSVTFNNVGSLGTSQSANFTTSSLGVSGLSGAGANGLGLVFIGWDTTGIGYSFSGTQIVSHGYSGGSSYPYFFGYIPGPATSFSILFGALSTGYWVYVPLLAL